jgi:hypothetical protein
MAKKQGLGVISLGLGGIAFHNQDRRAVAIEEARRKPKMNLLERSSYQVRRCSEMFISLVAFGRCR